jgi:5'-AMP-activated protein kinase, catalytic alpha subunit
VQREIRISSQLNHPHIIKIYDTMETAEDIYVVLEYAQSGELFDYITERGKLPESEARVFFQQLISGIEACHRKMVAHRDIKPENILLDKSNHIKIADFGLSNAMREGHFLKTSCGSPQYAAPEIVSGVFTRPVGLLANCSSQ